MTVITGVLFDKDGTLFDFEATWSAWAKAFLLDLSGGDVAKASVLGRALKFDFAACVFDPASPVIAGTPAEIAEYLVPLLPGSTPHGLMTRMNAAAAQAPQAEIVPLIPFLAELKDQGYFLGVATNDGESPARAHLNSAGVMAYVDFVAGSDSGFGAKPQPGQLRAFLDVTGQVASEVVMVGDSRHDLMAARAAGMRSVGVLTGLADRADLEPFADVVFDSIESLPAWLETTAREAAAA